MEDEYGAVERRRYLQQFCVIDPVQDHVALQVYYRALIQLFQQAEVYVFEQNWDQGYLYLKRFIALNAQVMKHQDYRTTTCPSTKLWLLRHADKAVIMLKTVVQYMADEEDEEIMNADCPPPVPGRPTSSDAVSQDLASRLLALRGTGTSSEDLPKAGVIVPLKPSNSFRKSAFDALRLQPTATPTKQRENYPAVVKPSWFSTPNEQSGPILTKTPTLGPDMRTLSIPTSLIQFFTKIAESNTKTPPRGIETCGILAGKLSSEKLVMDTLIIPKQQGSSDTCSMTNEEELFAYCIQHDLITLGWIHTHPSQTCFLSSVDIHTHYGYQTMLPEAVAIVISPVDEEKNVGVFRLTAPDGLQLIQNCKLTGFHQHPENVTIYTDAEGFEWQKQGRCKVVDLR